MGRESESGLPIEPVYGPGQPAGFDPAEKLGQPGQYPFTRGVYPTMYTTRPWTMRQYAGFATAEDSNRRYHELIEAGTTGLSVAFDLPTQTGYDSDHPAALGEVGKVGVPICHLGDMRALFAEIPLGTMNTSMTINATAAWLLALYVALEAKPGKEEVVAEFLCQGKTLVEAEPATIAWFGIRLGPSTFAIFDAFPDEAGRQMHLAGKVAAALMAKAGDLLAKPPSIHKADVLASKLPG